MPMTVPFRPRAFRRPDRWPAASTPKVVTPTTPYKIAGMRGLGDNIFQRPFVRVLAQRRPVYLITPWPELYDDIPDVHFVHEPTSLRTQTKNMQRHAATWVKAPRQVALIRVSYGHATLAFHSIVTVMQQCFGVAPDHFDLPPFPPFLSLRPVAVIRPATERREWHNSARGPRPEYIAEVAASLMKDYHVVSVADLVPGEEWLVDNILPPAHTRLHAGELAVPELLGLVQSAALVIGGVGWIVPACIAAGTPLFCILGGCGGHNAPEKVTDPRMDLSHVGFATPDHFCRCDRMQHTCDKTITDLHAQWGRWRQHHGI